MTPFETSKLEVKIEKKEHNNERCEWVLNTPEPPSLCHELVGSVKNTISQYRLKWHGLITSQPGPKLVLCFLKSIFPILHWAPNYTLSTFRNDLLSGLTIASLCIPQVIVFWSLNMSQNYNLVPNFFTNVNQLIHETFLSGLKCLYF